MESNLQIRLLTETDHEALCLKNDPFVMPGRLIPALCDGVWTYREELFDQPQEISFPDEHYDFRELSKNSFLYGAYRDDQCIGLAIFQKPMFRYLYLYDLKVAKGDRHLGVGRSLLGAGMKLAKSLGYRGIYTQAQDNNLSACRFYLNCGFRIGGFDNHVYKGTSQEGKADIFFYVNEEEFCYDRA